MLTQNNINELNQLADQTDRICWRLGEIALEAWNRNIQNGGQYHRFQIFTAIAREARCTKGKIEKLFAMVQFYPKEVREKYPGYKHGHYTVAMNFGPEKAADVLEYVSVYSEDKGELPRVNNLDFLYRRDVLGQETEDEMKGSVRKNPILAEQIINLLNLVRKMITGRPLNEEAKRKMNQGMKLIEEALPELVDEGKFINYN